MRCWWLLVITLTSCSFIPEKKISSVCKIESPRRSFRDLKATQYDFEIREELPVIKLKQSGHTDVFVGLKDSNIFCTADDKESNRFISDYAQKYEVKREIFIISVADRIVGLWEIYPEKTAQQVRSQFYTYSVAPQAHGGFNLFYSVYDEIIDPKGLLLSSHQFHQDDFLYYDLKLNRKSGSLFTVHGRFNEKNVSFSEYFPEPVTSHLGQEIFINSFLLDGVKSLNVFRYFPALNLKRPVLQTISKISDKKFIVKREKMKIPIFTDEGGHIIKIVEDYGYFSLEYQRVSKVE